MVLERVRVQRLHLVLATVRHVLVVAAAAALLALQLMVLRLPLMLVVVIVVVGERLEGWPARGLLVQTVHG